MENWISMIFSFILGGGLLSIFTFRYTSKNAKTEAYSKLENFWQESNENIRKEFTQRVTELEARIESLEITVCRRVQCKNRMK